MVFSCCFLLCVLCVCVLYTINGHNSSVSMVMPQGIRFKQQYCCYQLEGGKILQYFSILLLSLFHTHTNTHAYVFTLFGHDNSFLLYSHCLLMTIPSFLKFKLMSFFFTYRVFPQSMKNIKMKQMNETCSFIPTHRSPFTDCGHEVLHQKLVKFFKTNIYEAFFFLPSQPTIEVNFGFCRLWHQSRTRCSSEDLFVERREKKKRTLKEGGETPAATADAKCSVLERLDCLIWDQWQSLWAH